MAIDSDTYDKLHERHLKVCDDYNMAIIYLEGSVKLLREYLNGNGCAPTLDKRTADFLERFSRWNERKEDGG